MKETISLCWHLCVLVTLVVCVCAVWSKSQVLPLLDSSDVTQGEAVTALMQQCAHKLDQLLASQTSSSSRSTPLSEVDSVRNIACLLGHVRDSPPRCTDPRHLTLPFQSQLAHSSFKSGFVQAAIVNAVASLAATLAHCHSEPLLLVLQHHTAGLLCC